MMGELIKLCAYGFQFLFRVLLLRWERADTITTHHTTIFRTMMLLGFVRHYYLITCFETYDL